MTHCRIPYAHIKLQPSAAESCTGLQLKMFSPLVMRETDTVHWAGPFQMFPIAGEKRIMLQKDYIQRGKNLYK